MIAIPAQAPTCMPTAPFKRPRLLVVDDQPINIQTLYQIFQPDHEVFMATSGAQALEFCHTQTPPDLILLDILMPEMDGLEVCSRLKADASLMEIPVIFVTAQSSPSEETAALEAGGVDFITKPVTPAVVRARVKTHLTLKAQSDFLRSLAFIDGLTGIANRRHFEEALAVEWRSAQRRQQSLALLMIDVDNFKRYNDHYGHQAGDQCLQAIVATLPKHLGRAHDLAARYGGEEFTCLLPDCDVPSAKSIAEQLRQAVVELEIPHAASLEWAQVTISIGVAAVIPNGETTSSDLLKCADNALYAAKHNGRNRVELYSRGGV